MGKAPSPEFEPDITRHILTEVRVVGRSTVSPGHHDQNSTISRGSTFFATFCRLNPAMNLDFYRVLDDAKEKGDSVLEMTHP